MKVNPTSKIQYDANYSKDNSMISQVTSANKVARNGVSFKGSMSAKDGLADIMGFIEKKGFFAEFLLVDTLSMIIPRIVIGLSRDKEKTGKINYKAGAEEAGREILSGPSMILIPMGILEAVKHFTPAAKIPIGTMQELSSAFRSVINKTAGKSEDLNKDFARKLFDNAFGPLKLAEGQKDGFASKFVEILTGANSSGDEFEKLVAEINNKSVNGSHLNTKEIKLSKKVSVSPASLLEDFKHYSSDIVAKFKEQNFTKNSIRDYKKAAREFLKNIQSKRSLTRIATSVTSFLAVGGFLLCLPRLYQLGKISPAQESAKRAKEGGSNECK